MPDLLKTLICLSLAAAIWPVAADTRGREWQPFFNPVVSRADVQVIKNAFLGAGLEGEVFAVAKRGGRVVSQKTYGSEHDAKSALKALRLLQKLEASGVLGPFKVVKVLKREANVLDLEFIEGLSLSALIRNSSQDPRVRSLYASYLRGLKQVTSNISHSFRPARPVVDLDSYNKSCESSLSGLIVYDGTTDFPRQNYKRLDDDEDYYLDEEILFGIDPSNVVVERMTGDLFIIDPF